MNIFFIILITVTLAWDPNVEQDLAGYRVYRSEQPGVYGAPLASVTPSPTPQFVDPNVQPGKQYFYVLTATNTKGEESGRLNEVTAIIYMKQLTDAQGHVWGLVAPSVYLMDKIPEVDDAKDIAMVNGVVYIEAAADSRWFNLNVSTGVWTVYSSLPGSTQPGPDKLSPIVRVINAP